MNRIEKFLALYQSKQTANAYKWALTEFFKSVYGENEHKLEDQAERYFNEKRDLEEDMQNFFVAIKDKPPKSVKLMLAAVKSFFIENELELSQKFWRRLRGRIRGSRALTLDKIPNNRELKRILMHMPIHGKALYLTVESSGMRIGEALQLKQSDFDFEKNPCQINIRGEYTKTGNSRIAFTSKESVLALEEWFKVRKEYLKAAARKSHRFAKSEEDNRVFPFADSVAYMIWNKALKKSGFLKRDNSTNRRTIHPHVLRKFFRTRLGAVIPVDVVEALMGHEEYLTEVYRRYSMEDLAKFYLQGEPALLVFTEAEEVGKLRKEVEDRNTQLQNVINGLVAENTDLKMRIQKTEKKLMEIEDIVKALEKDT